MLPITLPSEQVELLMADAEDPNNEFTIDLPSQIIRRPDGSSFTFEVDAFRKHCLVNGLDDIGLTLQISDKITAFEKSRALNQPWVDNASQTLPDVLV